MRLALAALAAGQTEQFAVDLAPGSYTFFCSPPTREQLGMKQTVTVE